MTAYSVLFVIPLSLIQEEKFRFDCILCNEVCSDLQSWLDAWWTPGNSSSAEEREGEHLCQQAVRLSNVNLQATTEH